MRNEKYYVYVHRYPKNYPDKELAGNVFYVGKGQGNRIDHHERQARQGKKSHKCSIIRKIWAIGCEVDKEKVGFFNDENKAYQFEQDLILFLGKESLANLCDGGEGGARPGAGRPREYIKRLASFSLQLEEKDGSKGVLIGGVRWYNATEIQAIARYIEEHKAWLQGNA